MGQRRCGENTNDRPSEMRVEEGWQQMITPCDNCPNFKWCARHGCIVWNDESHALLERVQNWSKEQDRLMDELVLLADEEIQ
jgi:hypothetical protein